MLKYQSEYNYKYYYEYRYKYAQFSYLCVDQRHRYVAVGGHLGEASPVLGQSQHHVGVTWHRAISVT